MRTPESHCRTGVSNYAQKAIGEFDCLGCADIEEGGRRHSYYPQLRVCTEQPRNDIALEAARPIKGASDLLKGVFAEKIDSALHVTLAWHLLTKRAQISPRLDLETAVAGGIILLDADNATGKITICREGQELGQPAET